MHDNPVLAAAEAVAEKQGEFDASEMGVTAEELSYAIEAVMAWMFHDTTSIGGMPALHEEDLVYLLMLGLTTGYQLKTDQGETKIDATD